MVEPTATSLKSHCGSPSPTGELGAERPRGGSDVRAFVAGDNRSSGELSPSVMARPQPRAGRQGERGSAYCKVRDIEVQEGQ